MAKGIHLFINEINSFFNKINKHIIICKGKNKAQTVTRVISGGRAQF